MNGVVYQIVNRSRNSVYIGSTCNPKQRWKTHRRDLNANKHENIRLQRAWNKYGKAEFKFEILQREIEQDVLHVTEDALIAERRNAGMDVYNLRPSAKNNTGYKWTPESCQRASLARKGKPGHKGFKQTEETKQKLREARKRQAPASEETRRKISEANRGRITPDEVRLKISEALTGKKRTPEQRARMSAAQRARTWKKRGWSWSAEARARLSEAAKNRKPYARTDETKRKQSVAISQHWVRKKENGWTPVGKKPCDNCRREYKPLRKGLCHACNEYFRRHGCMRPVELELANQVRDRDLVVPAETRRPKRKSRDRQPTLLLDT